MSVPPGRKRIGLVEPAHAIPVTQFIGHRTAGRGGFGRRQRALIRAPVDLAIGVPPTAAAGRILTRPLFDERFVCIIRQGHPAADAQWDVATFLGLSHLLVSPENEGFGHVDAALSKQGLKRRLALTLPHMHAAPELIARSDMVATLLHGVVAASRHASALRVLDPPIELDPVVFVLSWHRRNDGHPAQRWFRDCIASLPAAADPF